MPHDSHLVLVVDDERPMREAMVAALEQEGLRAVAVGDGREALDAQRDGRLERCIIVHDLRMPTMAGWEFREEQLREPRLASIPVVVVSSYANPRREATSMGALAGLQKPIEVEAVSRLVARACRR